MKINEDFLSSFLSTSEPELSGQHCLGPVLVRFLSGFSGKFCLVSVRCPDFVRIRCPLSVCPDFVCRDFVRCPDSVRIPMNFFVRCLSVRIFTVAVHLILVTSIMQQKYDLTRNCDFY